MDWEAKEKEAKRKREEERQRLIAMSDYEAESLPVPDRYQRIRYLREIYAARWLEDERRKVSPILPIKTYKRHYAKKSKVARNIWND